MPLALSREIAAGATPSTTIKATGYEAPRAPSTTIMIALFLLSALVGVVFAQDLTIPGQWREFAEDRTLADRITLASTSIDQMAALIDSTTAEVNGISYWGTAATVLSPMANFDHFTNSTRYQAQVTDTLNTAFNLYPNYDQFGFSDDATWWGTAAFYAFRAYGDQNLLSHATATWDHVSQFQITADTASSGRLAAKNFTVEGTCDGDSMVGGVFWRPVENDAAVNSITTGLFMTLSAYLAQTTGNDTYTQAATAAGNWIKNANKNSAGIVLDTIDGQSCTRSPDNFIFTYNSGKYVEGLVALYSVTKDASLLTEATNVVAAGMKNAPWQGANGVITEGASPDVDNDDVYFKAVWVRALNELFRATPDAQLGTLLHSYLVVQYNAMLELAANGTTYSSAWNGPPQNFTPWGQAVALDNLVAGITSTT